ncbi:MDR family MFS transporter [Actinacidiphila sp. DG2A-62]|uniref:MDR family MFS transporter n=1 Tax=Actinacidiphila sp. DG2A-62 TaxID=3108821 RepID=UPI002DB55D28|nr:MDR family MFS transporter [Actinacidiphila sp. DG2A-62]MEC3997327.1 MDR family MFS transporter [Actinacidiphila sp. DG2A-62]
MSPPPAETPRRTRLVLLGVMLAMLLAMLDTNVVGTAMPTIVRDLGGLDHISWVVTAYALTTAVSTPVWGKLGDLYGRKRLFLISIAVFLLGSCLSGASRSMTQLIGFRALQGLGAGGLGAGALALVASLVPPRERGRYQGMTASVMAVGTVGGPLLGGQITGHLGWRWAFYLNLPIGVVALVWVAVMLRLPAARGAARVDWSGIALMTAAISATVLGTTWAGSTYAWGSWQVLTAAGVALAAGAGFLARERRAVEPVLPLRMFTGHRNFPLSVGMLAAVGVVMFGCSLYVPLYQQTVQHASVSDSGLLLLPLMAPVAVVSTFAGKAMSRTGRYKVFPVAGTALLTAGMLLLASMGAGTSFWLTSAYLMIAGAGLGLTMQMSGTIAQNSVAMRDIGAASGTTALFRTLGGSLGVAAFGSLLTAATGHGPAGGPHTAAYAHGVATGTRHIFLLAAGVCAVAFVLALCVREVPLRGAASGGPGGPGGPAGERSASADDAAAGAARFGVRRGRRASAPAGG